MVEDYERISEPKSLRNSIKEPRNKKRDIV